MTPEAPRSAELPWGAARPPAVGKAHACNSELPRTPWTTETSWGTTRHPWESKHASFPLHFLESKPAAGPAGSDGVAGARGGRWRPGCCQAAAPEGTDGLFQHLAAQFHGSYWQVPLHRWRFGDIDRGPNSHLSSKESYFSLAADDEEEGPQR